MTAANSIRCGVLAVAFSVLVLGSSACGSSPAQFMGSRYPDAYSHSPGESFRTAAMQVGLVVGTAVAVAGCAIGYLWLTSQDDDEPLGQVRPDWDD